MINYLRMHENNRKLTNQLASKCSEEKSHFNNISDDNAETITVIGIRHP